LSGFIAGSGEEYQRISSLLIYRAAELNEAELAAIKIK
jgi:hypothetical protein